MIRLRRDESLQASLASRIPEPISGCHELYPHGQSLPKLPGPGFPLSNDGSAGGSQFDEPIVVDGPVDSETLAERLCQQRPGAELPERPPASHSKRNTELILPVATA